MRAAERDGLPGQSRRELDRVRTTPRRGAIHSRIRIGRFDRFAQSDLTIDDHVIGNARDRDDGWNNPIFQPFEPSRCPAPATPPTVRPLQAAEPSL